MSCQYLRDYGFFGHDYQCDVTKASISGRWVDDMCDAEYTDCDHYPRSGGGCFITTAVCRSLGKPDDCDELTTLRAIRDGWLAKQEYGPRATMEYYRIAPEICAAIDRLDDPDAKYESIHKTWLAEILESARRGDEQRAYEIYVSMVRELEAVYLSD